MKTLATNRVWIVISSVLGGLGVILGAFGAHALKGKLSDYEMGVYETAVFYQLTHTSVLLAISAIESRCGKLLVARLAFTFGILVFSGSLYLLAVSGWSWLGAVTPMGGLGLIVGWGFLLGWALGGRPTDPLTRSS